MTQKYAEKGSNSRQIQPTVTPPTATSRCGRGIGATDLFSVRLHTTNNDLNGDSPAVLTGSGTATTNLTHVVYTRAANGDVTLYINGSPVNGTMFNGSRSVVGDPVVDGSLSGSGGWNDSYRLGLADEFGSTGGPLLGRGLLIGL